jgi:hypothetical protein
MTTTTKTNDVIGQALYIEVAYNAPGNSMEYTTQVLITPEGTLADGGTITMAAVRRRLSTKEPRKMWKTTKSYTTMARAKERQALIVPSANDASVVDDMLLSFKSGLDSLIATSYTASTASDVNTWVLRGVPIVVDVTRDDLEDIRLAKTPYKVLGRVWRSRKKLGYPVEFLNER